MDSLNLQLDDRMVINFNSVEDLPGLNARAIFEVDSSSVFKEDTDIVPTQIAPNCNI
jgi:hypothetical protein